MASQQHASASSAAMDAANPVQLMSHFYQQVVEIKHWIQEGELNDQVTAMFNLTHPPSSEETADAVALKLQRWIEGARLIASKTLTERECERVEQTLFVLVALADELFIMEIDWPGREQWLSQPLEDRLFNSCFAGERFFRGADELLTKRSWEETDRLLASVYLFALRLGFCGRYRDNNQRLKAYRAQLFKRIGGGMPMQLVCPAAYQSIMSSQQEHRLAPLAAWYRNMTIGGLLYLAVGWAIWQGIKGYWG